MWVGRGAMLGFIGVIALEISTGKGVLEVRRWPLPRTALFSALCWNLPRRPGRVGTRRDCAVAPTNV